MTVMGHRQQHSAFQVLDGPQEFDATAGGFTMDLLSGFLNGHVAPSWDKTPYAESDLEPVILTG